MLNIIKVQIIIISIMVCTSCVSSMMSVSQVVYDRHEIQQDVIDHQLQVKANHALFDHYPHLKRENISITAYNKDLIVIGQVQYKSDKLLVDKTLNKLPDIRRLFNELTIGKKVSFVQSIKDSWITSKIRARMVTANDIKPSDFKIITENSVVYILGDVKKEQAKIVVSFAQQTSGVTKVVRVLKYYQYVL